MKELKRNFISIKILKLLLTWHKVCCAIFQKDFKYDEHFYNMVDVNEKVKIDATEYIDNLIVDSYWAYEKVKNTTEDICNDTYDYDYDDEDIDMLKDMLGGKFPIIFDCSNEKIKENINKSFEKSEQFLRIYEYFIMNYLFETANARGLQKNMINDLIKRYTTDEDYEKCAELRDKLTQI